MKAQRSINTSVLLSHSSAPMWRHSQPSMHCSVRVLASHYPHYCFSVCVYLLPPHHVTQAVLWLVI